MPIIYLFEIATKYISFYILGFEEGNEENFIRQRIYHSRDLNNACGIPPLRTLPPLTAKGKLTPNKNCASLSDQVWKSSLVWYVHKLLPKKML